MKPLSERAAELIIAMKGSRDIDPAKLPDLLVQIGDALRKVDAMDGEPARAPSAKSKVAPKSKTPSARKKTAAAPKQKVAAAASQAVGRGGTKRSGQAAPAQPKQAKKSSKKREEDMIPGLPPRKRGRPSKAEIAERERIIKAYKAAQRAERARKKAAAERLVSPSLHEPDIKPYKGARAPGDPAVPIEESVTDNYIICLEDGKKLKTLTRYLKSRWSMGPEEYRVKWNLPNDYPFVAASYARLRSKAAGRTGSRKAAG